MMKKPKNSRIHSSSPGGLYQVVGAGGRDSVMSDIGESCSSLNSWSTPEHYLSSTRLGSNGVERRRRKLPEIPKNKKCKTAY